MACKHKILSLITRYKAVASSESICCAIAARDLQILDQLLKDKVSSNALRKAFELYSVINMKDFKSSTGFFELGADRPP